MKHKSVVFSLLFFINLVAVVYGQDTASQLEDARNAARSKLNREEQHRQRLAMYDATDYKHLSQMTMLEYTTNPDVVYNFEQQWERISPGLVIVVGRDNIDIYGGAKENIYILQTSYMTPDDYHFGTMTYRQLVIQDDIGLITVSHTRTIPNANGPDLIERYYKIGVARILIKCVGFTNITLGNGRLVSRPLFRTIHFNKDDPNNPERSR